MSGCGLAPFALARLQRVAASVDDVNEERPKAVVLRPMGECPQWGAEPGAETPMDGPIREGRDAPFEEQRELFFGLVRHLHDGQVRVPEDKRDDPSDNDEWIATLALWFGWDDDIRDIEKARAAKAAYEVLDCEIEERPAPMPPTSARNTPTGYSELSAKRPGSFWFRCRRQSGAPSTGPSTREPSGRSCSTPAARGWTGTPPPTGYTASPRSPVCGCPGCTRT